jgi:DNA-directed RNA polymerase subunit H (RpoH/RPB5)
MPKKKKPIDNIINHVLVPNHIILSDKEKDALVKNLKIEANQLPKILTTDSVCLSIGAKSGQIVKIVRESHTAKESIAYRMVVEDNK